MKSGFCSCHLDDDMHHSYKGYSSTAPSLLRYVRIILYMSPVVSVPVAAIAGQATYLQLCIANFNVHHHPVIVAGDMNATPDHAVYSLFRRPTAYPVHRAHYEAHTATSMHIPWLQFVADSILSILPSAHALLSVDERSAADYEAITS